MKEDILKNTIFQDYDTVIFDLDGVVWDCTDKNGTLIGAYKTVSPYERKSREVVVDIEGNIITLQKDIDKVLGILDDHNINLGIVSTGQKLIDVTNRVESPFESQPSILLLKKFGLFNYFNYDIILKAFAIKSDYVKPLGKTLFIDDTIENINDVKLKEGVDVLWRGSFQIWKQLLLPKKEAFLKLSWKIPQSNRIEITKDNWEDYNGLLNYFVDPGDIIYLNDKNELHRINGPAIEYSNGDRYWFENGKRHRLDGPAIEFSSGSKEYWINGRQLSEEEFNNQRNSNLKFSNQSSQLALVSHPEYYNFTQGEGVWQMNQYQKALDELQHEGHLEGTEQVQPELLTEEESNLVHTPQYTNNVFRNPEDAYHIAWEGGPWNESAQKAVLRSSGGMVKSNDEALRRGVAVQLYDAFHHAYPNKGEGFCVLNDVAIAAKKISQQGKRVMVVDTDVHQGQGTAVCTQGDPNIYTLSLHEEYNYPGFKEKSSQDVGYGNGITDGEYLKLLSEALKKAISEFGRPDLVMYVAGTDMYRGDQLSSTEVTLQGIQMRDQMVFNFFGNLGVPVSVSVPQGYAKDPQDSVIMIKNTIKEAKNAFNKYYNKIISNLKLSWKIPKSDKIEITRDNRDKYDNLTGFDFTLGTIIYLNNENKLHRLDGPAVEYKDGGKVWYQNGKLHRIDGPAVERANGDKWWYQNGLLHRLDGPAVEKSNGYREYGINGQSLTEEEFNNQRNGNLKLSWKKPESERIEITEDNREKYREIIGSIFPSGTIIYLNDKNQLHRIDGPAIERVNGDKLWYENGKRHRLNGPAIEDINGDKYWYQNGLLHRLDGPAVECVHGNKYFWINGHNLTENEFNNQRTADFTKVYRDIKEYILTVLEPILSNVTYNELNPDVVLFFENEFKRVFNDEPEALEFIKAIRIDFKYGEGIRGEYFKGENRFEFYSNWFRDDIVLPIKRNYPVSIPEDMIERFRKYFIDKYLNKTVIHELVHSLQDYFRINNKIHTLVAPYPQEDIPEYRQYGQFYMNDLGEKQAADVENRFNFSLDEIKKRKIDYGNLYSNLKLSWKELDQNFALIETQFFKGWLVNYIDRNLYGVVCDFVYESTNVGAVWCVYGTWELTKERALEEYKNWKEGRGGLNTIFIPSVDISMGKKVFEPIEYVGLSL